MEVAVLRLCLAFLLALSSLGFPAPVASLEPPSGRVLLTVETGGDAPPVRFDRAMLEALDWQEITTHTSFTDGPQRFAGPTLAALLDALDVREGVLKATAINDYSVTIPVVHARAHDVLLALDHGGRPMRVRDKGPVWVIYPLTAEQAARQPFDSEMIWQLVRFTVLP
jgi:hypothetical protein